MGTLGFPSVVSSRDFARRIVVLGRQGSGKGTQCDALARRLLVPHISAGDALRRAVRTGITLGGEVKSTMEAGELVRDDLVVKAIWDHIGDRAASGFVLDGFPRTVEQARLLENLLGGAGVQLAVRLEVPVEKVVSRLSRRRVCTVCGLDHPGAEPGAVCDRCGNPVAPRSDDTPAAIRSRLALHDRHEPALVAWLALHTELVSVNGDGTPEAVAGRIWATVRGHPATRTVTNDSSRRAFSVVA